MSRFRWQILIGLVLVLGISLTACVAPAAPAGDGMADSGDSDAMMPEVMLPDDAAEDQILNVVHEGGCGSGPFPGIDYGSPCNFGHMFMPPFLVDIDGNVMPGLFTTDWEVNEDPHRVYLPHPGRGGLVRRQVDYRPGCDRLVELHLPL